MRSLKVTMRSVTGVFLATVVVLSLLILNSLFGNDLVVAEMIGLLYIVLLAYPLAVSVKNRHRLEAKFTMAFILVLYLWATVAFIAQKMDERESDRKHARMRYLARLVSQGSVEAAKELKSMAAPDMDRYLAEHGITNHGIVPPLRLDPGIEDLETLRRLESNCIRDIKRSEDLLEKIQRRMRKVEKAAPQRARVTQ